MCNYRNGFEWPICGKNHISNSCALYNNAIDLRHIHISSCSLPQLYAERTRKIHDFFQFGRGARNTINYYIVSSWPNLFINSICFAHEKEVSTARLFSGVAVTLFTFRYDIMNWQTCTQRNNSQFFLEIFRCESIRPILSDDNSAMHTFLFMQSKIFLFIPIS